MRTSGETGEGRRATRLKQESQAKSDLTDLSEPRRNGLARHGTTGDCGSWVAEGGCAHGFSVPGFSARAVVGAAEVASPRRSHAGIALAGPTDREECGAAMKTRLTLPVTLVYLLAFACYASAQELVYTPVNPSFGGSPFNSSHLLAIAEIHRPEEPPSSSSLFDSRSIGSTRTSFFVRQLENRILSRLSLDITNAIFGDDAEPSGTFTFGDTELTFETLLDGTIVVQITDNTTGDTTTIEIPAFLTGP